MPGHAPPVWSTPTDQESQNNRVHQRRPYLMWQWVPQSPTGVPHSTVVVGCRYPKLFWRWRGSTQHPIVTTFRIWIRRQGGQQLASPSTAISKDTTNHTINREAKWTEALHQPTDSAAHPYHSQLIWNSRQVKIKRDAACRRRSANTAAHTLPNPNRIRWNSWSKCHGLKSELVRGVD
jgi:hypothetical protein